MDQNSYNSTNQTQPSPAPTVTQPPVLSQPPSKKSPVWIIAIIAAVIIAGVAGIWLWASSAAASYDKSLPAYEERVQKAYDDLNEQPADTAAYRVYLQENASAFKAVIDSAPKQPTIVGFAVGSSEVKQRVDELTSAAQKTQTAMEEYLAFIVYRDSLLEIIKDNTGRISTPDDIRAFKTKIEANNKKLDELKPPSGLEEYAQEKKQIYQDILDDLTNAIEAYDAKKADEYTNHVLKLADDAKRITVQKVADELLDNHTYYDAFIKAAEDLEALLKK